MRLVTLDQLGVGDRLGRDVRVGPSAVPLLRAGVRLSPRYVEGLRDAGISRVYVDDAISAGIEPQTVLSDRTRHEAAAALGAAFDTVVDVKSGAAVTVPEHTIGALKEIAALIVTDVLACEDAAVALQDLATMDAYTLEHSVDVTALGVLLGERHARVHGWIDWSGTRRYDRLEQRLILLGTGLMLHDIGKLAVPSEVLEKPGKLTPEEWALVREHPTIGYRMLSKTQSISEVAKTVVRGHHERWNGSGYPQGQLGEQIPPLARLAAVADVFDAITAERAYKEAAPVHVGVRAIAEGDGTLFEPAVVATFVSTVAPYPPGISVELSDGRRGIVADCPVTAVDRPVVRIVEAGQPVCEVELQREKQLQVVAVGVDLAEVAA